MEWMTYKASQSDVTQYAYRFVVSTNEISLVDTENHVANAETGAFGRTAFLNVGNKNAAAKFGMFALDDHDAQALRSLRERSTTFG